MGLGATGVYQIPFKMQQTSYTEIPPAQKKPPRLIGIGVYVTRPYCQEDENIHHHQVPPTPPGLIWECGVYSELRISRIMSQICIHHCSFHPGYGIKGSLVVVVCISFLPITDL